MKRLNGKTRLFSSVGQSTCNLGVVGSNPTRGSSSRKESGEEKIVEETKGVFQSGQMGQTVNLLVFTFGGSNPSAPTNKTMRK